MKFITTCDEVGREEIFVFSRRIHHDAMAEALARIKDQTHGSWRRVYRKPIAAGFVNAVRECYGESETLGLKARDEDTRLMRRGWNES